MLRLINFLSANRNVIIFLALELIALNLIVRTNEVPRHQVGDAMLQVSGRVHEAREGVFGYFALERKNQQLQTADSLRQREVDSLRAEVIRLRSLLELESDSVFLAWQDRLRGKVDSFRFIPARVMRNSTHKAYNYLTLNKGLRHGVQTDQGVVGPQGVVGKVIKVSEDYALVQSAINLDFRVPVKVQRPDTVISGYPEEGFLGFFRWQGSIIAGKVMNLPETAASLVKGGDWVVTAGSSTIFPPGIRVGTLSGDQGEAAQGVYNHPLQLSVDFSTLSHVYIVESPKRDTLEAMEAGLPQQ